MKYDGFKAAVIAAAKERGLAEYELYYMEEESVSVSTHQREVDKFSDSVSGGVCFRCIVDGKMGYAATELLSEEQAAAIVDRAIENARTIENTDQVFIYSAGDSYRETASVVPELPKAEAMIPFVLDCQTRAYEADPRVCDGTSSQFGAGRITTYLTNSKGLDLKNVSGYQAGIVGAVLKEGDQKYNYYDYKIGAIHEINRKELVNSAVEKAAAAIGAEVVDSGKYTVVIDAEAMGDLLAIFCAVFSADMAQKGLSLLKGKEGEAIAAPCVTLTDDPFYPGSTVQTSFDSEGVATYTKDMIKGGVLQTLAHNLKTAAKDGRKSTGNGYKGSYASSVSVAPYTFYLQPGEKGLEELFASVGNGIYLTEVSGGHAGANFVTGDFSLQSAGFRIENGKKGQSIRGFTTAGNFFTLLKDITQVGNDLKFGFPSGFTTFGSPSVVVKELSVAGK